MDQRIEVVSVPVSDADRARAFYQGLGWRLDADFHYEGGGRVVQVTPPGSACSLSFGGLQRYLELVVDDIDEGREELADHGATVGSVFHREGGKQVPGPDPKHRSYNSLAQFSDPDGNSWLLQEVTTRLPGRTSSPLAVYGSVANLADALRRAADAHARHEREIGHPDPDWPTWYAQYLANESADRGSGS
jgi:catechol 2,3-dioxygenase-like lactoylglutathione lyase family enzyme